MRLTLAIALLAAAPFAAATPTFAGALDAPSLDTRSLDTAAIDRAAARILARTKVPSASIAIVRDGRIVYTHAYGMQAPGKPAVTTARYPIASISKQITATAILMLADDGKLSLDDKVGKYLPELTDADTVAVRQLLSHTSGYRDYWPQDYPFAAMDRPVTPDQILARWAKAPLDFVPGSQWQYSNTGYVAAGQILEKAAGAPYLAFLTKRVFQPLGITSAVDADTGLTRADAVPHKRYALGPVRVEQPAAPGWLFAAGELAMTAGDLARWDIGMIDRKLLSAGGYEAQQTPVVLSDGKSTGYGLGVHIDTVGHHRRLSHGGEAVGFLSENRVYPDDRAAIVVLDNADFGDAQDAIADAIEAELFPEVKPKAAPADIGGARGVFDMLRAGRIDRSRFTDNGNAYFTPVALADYKASLTPLGEPLAFEKQGGALRGGFTEEVYRIRYSARTLTLVVRAEPGAGGRIEQFTVYPAS